MKVAKIVAICFVFLMGSILLGGFSSKSWAVMPESQKKKPMQQPTAIPSADCMSKYHPYYDSLGGSGAPLVPIDGISVACENCLQNWKGFSRPWSDAVKNCHQSCGCQ